MLPGTDPSYSVDVDEKPDDVKSGQAAERCVFKLTSDALIVANTGRPFSRQGVISICYAHLSEKGRVPPTDNYDVASAGLVQAVAERTLQVYRGDINRIGSDSVSEDELQRDYGGRCTWELPQNADDACAPEGSTTSELIGAKGIGFKSVLEITNEPEIHSGPFHFLLRLDEGQRAVEWFQMRDRLSAVVNITPHWEADCGQPRIAGTYGIRKPALRAMLRRDLAAAERVREVCHLRINISREQNQIATVRVAAWNEDGEILVDAEDGPRGLAIALGFHRGIFGPLALEPAFRTSCSGTQRCLALGRIKGSDFARHPRVGNSGCTTEPASGAIFLPDRRDRRVRPSAA